MSVKTILVPVGGLNVDDATFRAAVSLARCFVGHIDFLYVRTEPVITGSVHGEVFIPQMLEQLHSAAEQLHERSRQSHLAACAAEGIPTDIADPAAGVVTARWLRETGSIEGRVAAQGHVSDLIVACRSGGVLTAQALEGALFDSGRPVVVPGSVPLSLDTIAIAWKPTREAARAVSAALPLLQRAKRVVILSVAESGAPGRADPERLAANVQRHCPSIPVQTCSVEPESFDVADALLTQADHFGAGILVTGAYGHSRLRELILGGVTDSLLRLSGISLFMAH